MEPASSWILVRFIPTVPQRELCSIILDSHVFVGNKSSGVPVVAQRLANPTRNHEVAGSVPALAQWVNDPALP